jgi:hypothetical protein
MAHNRYPNRRWIFLTSGDAATGVNFNQVMETSPATCRYNIAPTPGTETFVKYNVTQYPQHSGEEPQIMVYSGWHQNTPLEGGWVNSLSIVSSGEGYGSDGNLIASGGGGTGFAGTFTQEGGAISSVAITNSGEYYTSSPEIIIDSPDGGSGSVSASLVSTDPTWQSEEQYPETAVQSGTDDTYKYDYEVTGSGAYLEWSKSTMAGGGWIDSLSIMNGGSGYSSDGNLAASGGGGNGFAGTFTQDSGVIDSVHITNSGEYYTTNPTVIIDNADGSGGEVFASVNPGEPTEPAVTGTGYYPLYADNILGSGFFAASGQTTGQPDCFDLALEIEASGGTVTALDIVSGGSAYGSSGNLTAVGGGGNGFAGTFLTTASGGWVDALYVITGGSGYNENGTLTAVGGGGSGFAGTFSQTSGVINSAMIVDQGENYVSAPEIAIVSAGEVNGTGGIVSSSILLSGAINSVTLENAGHGYVSEPTIVIGTNGVDGVITATTNSWSASGYEFDHTDMLNVLSGPDWTSTGIM